MADNYLLVSDIQLPFEAEKALEFCLYLKKHFNVPDENVICVGDEVDQYFGSMFNKDPDGIYTPTSEINITIDKIKQWVDAFPKIRVCISNHGMRWAKKAAEAELPSQMLKKYQQVLKIPSSWRYKLEWKIKTKHPFRVIHGMGYSGDKGHLNAALDAGMSTAMGHLVHLGAQHIRKGISEKYLPALKIWGMCVSCLIDPEAYAFHYGKDNRNKPALGAGVVLNSGTTPLPIPFDL